MLTSRSEEPSQRERAREERARRRERRRLGREAQVDADHLWRVWIENRRTLYRRCLGWTNGNVTDTEDLLGQLLMRLIRLEGSELEKVKCPRAWMTRILRHLYIDLVRGNRRAVSHDLEIERSLHASGEIDPAAEVWRGELSEALHSAIDALPASLRGPLVQRYLEGLPYQDIARNHHITPPTARKRCQLARDRIRQTLKITLSQT